MKVKKKTKKHEKLWIKIKDLIRSITKNSFDYDYDEKYIKIKFDSDDKLPLSEVVEIPTITVVVHFYNYPQVFLGKCQYQLWKMESRNGLKEIDFKKCSCYYFDDIINGADISFNNILWDKKLYKNIAVYDILYKTSAGPKTIRFNKIKGFIMVLHGKINYLLLFDYGLFDKICDKIKYVMNEKSGITDSINHNFGRITFDSYNSFSIQKILTFHNMIILIKSVVNMNKNEYYYNIFLEKSSCKD